MYFTLWAVKERFYDPVDPPIGVLLPFATYQSISNPMIPVILETISKSAEKLLNSKCSPNVVASDGHFVFEEVVGDLLSKPAAFALAHCVSCDFKMNRGIVVEFKHFGSRRELRKPGLGVGSVATQFSEGCTIFYLITKAKSSDKPTLQSFTDAVDALAVECVKLKIDKLAIPHLGYGLDELERIEVSLHHYYKIFPLSIKLEPAIWSHEKDLILSYTHISKFVY